MPDRPVIAELRWTKQRYFAYSRGGEGGIRTHETRRFTAVRVRRTQPDYATSPYKRDFTLIVRFWQIGGDATHRNSGEWCRLAIPGKSQRVALLLVTVIHHVWF